MTLKAWSFDAVGSDGLCYSVRLLATTQELEGWQRAGLVPQTAVELVGMQDAADQLVAQFEREAYVIQWGALQ
jgi:hypothetical protein